MTPDEATVALYKCMYYNEHKTKLEEVKQYVEAGARLRDIETLYGPPLLCALENMCPITVLNYLIEKGGIDWSYKKGGYLHYSEDDPWFEIMCIKYHTYRNELIRLWHYCKVTYKELNQELVNMFKIHDISEELYKNHLMHVPKKEDSDIELYEEYSGLRNARRHRYGETYPEEVCKLFGVTPEELENGILDLPDSIFDISLLPKEDKPYCWNHFMTPGYKMYGHFMFAILDIDYLYNEE